MISKPKFKVEEKYHSFIEQLMARYEMDGAYMLDGWEDQVVGVFTNIEGVNVFVYDAEAIIDKMVDEDGLSEEDAWDHFYFNVHGANLGPRTPLFLQNRELVNYDEVAN